jgi:xanthine dehydrogenase YagR molybdenum-binding subunit
MATDTPATNVIGLPIDRVDGPSKVTGRATYAYEYAENGKAAYGYILGAAITGAASPPSTPLRPSVRRESFS